MDWMLIGRGATVVVAGVLATFGNPVVRGLLRRMDRPPRVDDADVAVARANLGLAAAQRELPGGRWIGMLERLAVYACIVTGFPAGIAMVLAVKGLGRYADLATSDTPRTGELFIVGTFASLLWAALWSGVGWLAVWWF